MRLALTYPTSSVATATENRSKAIIVSYMSENTSFILRESFFPRGFENFVLLRVGSARTPNNINQLSVINAP